MLVGARERLGETRPVEPSERLGLARERFARAQVAGLEPEDWAELSMWAFYALENAVVAAADHLHVPWERSHPSEVEVSRTLRGDHGLPDVSSLLIELNALRKSAAYGEVQSPPSITAEAVVGTVEGFIEAVSQVVGGGGSARGSTRGPAPSRLTGRAALSGRSGR